MPETRNDAKSEQWGVDRRRDEGTFAAEFSFGKIAGFRPPTHFCIFQLHFAQYDAERTRWRLTL
jgi:hypothetical protein